MAINNRLRPVIAAAIAGLGSFIAAALVGRATQSWPGALGASIAVLVFFPVIEGKKGS
jgi:hypothetical protein